MQFNTQHYTKTIPYIETIYQDVFWHKCIVMYVVRKKKYDFDRNLYKIAFKTCALMLWNRKMCAINLKCCHREHEQKKKKNLAVKRECWRKY